MSDLCHQLHQLFADSPRLRFPFAANSLPKNGIYVLFEAGELAHGSDRIVRVGTHTGQNQLPSRLNQHFVKENKDRSIFRKNIGRAILNGRNDPFLAQWELDLTTREAKNKYGAVVDLLKLQNMEKEVTETIQRNFSFVVFRVDHKEERLRWESRMISTISLCNDCRPSANWLGLHSPKAKIRQSGLWLVNELNKLPLNETDYIGIENALRGIA